VQTLKLDIYSDVICPWCYIGKRRLESAIEQLPSGVELDIKWRAFELNPNLAPEGVERRAYRVAKFGSWERSQELDQQVAAAGAEVGIAFNFVGMERTPNTFDCHRVIWLAEQANVQGQVVEGLFRAYFVDCHDLSNRQVLSDVAAECGLPKARTKNLLETEEGSRELKAEERAANALGVTGVPFFVFEDRIGFSGAQHEEVFLKAIRAAMEERASVAMVNETASECNLNPGSGDQAESCG